jgi:hypothetical protein
MGNKLFNKLLLNGYKLHKSIYFISETFFLGEYCILVQLQIDAET